MTAFVVLTGKMDSMIFEDLFFESLAVAPAVERAAAAAGEEEEKKVVLAESTAVLPATERSRGLSLSDLGVDFSDVDFETMISPDNKKEEDEEHGLKILERDLVELFVLLLWIVQTEPEERLVAQGEMSCIEPNIRQLAERLVLSMKPEKEKTGTEDDDGLPCVSHQRFYTWKKRNAPYLFRTIQSFIYSKFAMSVQGSLTSMSSSDLLLVQDATPMPDVSDILNMADCALLSWCLPEVCMQVKQWTRLYSGVEHGFSMNRFESHVFRYPGPTLLLVRGENLNTQGGRTVTVGAYVPDSWKHGHQYWGSEACFLFELSPTFEVFRPTRCNQQYIYYHDDFGIGFGGTSRSLQPPKKKRASLSSTSPLSFMLYLNNTLQSGVYAQELYPASATFETSDIRKEFHHVFDTVDIEVFGLGDEKARKAQEREWQFERREAMRRAGLQIRQADGQSVDRELLRMAGLIDDDNRQER